MPASQPLRSLWPAPFVYLAAVAQLTWLPDSGPQLLLATAAWIVCSESSRTGILWAMLTGLCLDAISHGRMGMHLATCGSLAAVTFGTILAGGRTAFWQRPVVAGWLTMGDSAISSALQRCLVKEPIDLAAVSQQAAWVACQTAGAVAAVAVLLELTRRCCYPYGTRTAVHLTNEWSRLSET